jgi:hypothetical protein
MRSCRTYGSVRGVPGNWHPYRDSLEQPENIRLDPHYMRTVRFTYVSADFLDVVLLHEYLEPQTCGLGG